MFHLLLRVVIRRHHEIFPLTLRVGSIKEQKVDENRVKARTCVGEALSRREHGWVTEGGEAHS